MVGQAGWRREWERAVKGSTEHPDAWFGPAISRATVVVIDAALRLAEQQVAGLTEDVEAERARVYVAEAERDDWRERYSLTVQELDGVREQLQAAEHELLRGAM
jgi:hypothetical protein